MTGPVSAGRDGKSRVGRRQIVLAHRMTPAEIGELATYHARR